MENFDYNDYINIIAFLESSLDSIYSVAQTYYEEKELYNQSDDYLELESRKGKENYEKLRKLLLNGTYLPDRQGTKNISLIDFYTLLEEILLKIYGHKYAKQIKDYLSEIKEYDCHERMLNIYEFEHGLNLNDAEDKLNELHVGIFARNFTIDILEPHYTVDFNKTFLNTHYQQIPEILVSYIAIEELRKITKDESVIEKFTSTNLAQISKLIKENYLIKQSPAANSISFFKNICPEASARMEEKTKKIDNWSEHYTFKHLIGDIYASKLFLQYCKDKEVILHYLKELLQKEKSMIDILVETKTTLTDPSTFNTYKKKLETYKTS